jgi:hypothetical protein
MPPHTPQGIVAIVKQVANIMLPLPEPEVYAMRTMKGAQTREATHRHFLAVVAWLQHGGQPAFLLRLHKQPYLCPERASGWATA